MNIESCSGITIKWLFYRFTRNRTAITNDDIDEFVSRYCAPGAMRAGFEYYRAFPINEEQNKALSKTKLQIPVLALGGVIYPALGGDAPVNFALDSTQGLAENVKGGHSSTFRALHCRRAARIFSRPAVKILWEQYSKQ
jgi:hypothetical protein